MQYDLSVIVIIPILFGVLNMVRGSDNFAPWFKGKIFNAVLYGAALFVSFYHVTPLPALLVLCGLSIPAMLGAMSFGWGEYVGAQLENRSKKDTEVPFIDILISKLESKPRVWGFAGNTLRGLLGGVILAVPFLLVGLFVPATLITIGSSLMGLAFAIAALFPPSLDRWKVGEAFMGAFIGVAVAISALWKRKK